MDRATQFVGQSSTFLDAVERTSRAAPLPAVQAQIERRLRQTFDPHGLFTRD